MTSEIDWRGHLESPADTTIGSTGFLVVSGWLLNVGSPVQSMTVTPVMASEAGASAETAAGSPRTNAIATHRMTTSVNSGEGSI